MESVKINGENEAFLREGLQDSFAALKTLYEEPEDSINVEALRDCSCRLSGILRKLENHFYINAEYCCFKTENVTDILYGLFRAAGTMLLSAGVTLRASVEIPYMEIAICRKAVENGVLNLLANAAENSADGIVKAGVVKNGEYLDIIIKNSAKEKSHFEFKSGLNAVSSIAGLHGGGFVAALGKDEFSAILRIRIHK